MSSTILLFTIFGLLLIAVAGLVMALFRGRRAPSPQEAAAELQAVARGPLADRAFQPLTRLLAAEDVRFLRAHPGYEVAMQRRFFRSRRQALALYLKALKSEFERVWSLSRALIPISKDPDFAIFVTRQFLIFYSLYLTIRVQMILGSFGLAPAAPLEVVLPLRRLLQAGATVSTSQADTVTVR